MLPGHCRISRQFLSVCSVIGEPYRHGWQSEGFKTTFPATRQVRNFIFPIVDILTSFGICFWGCNRYYLL